MACPYFYPTERIEQRLWPKPERLPLGDGYAGVCRADAGCEFRPGEAMLKDCCNLGYPRSRCGRFPKQSAEAVRFSIASDSNGRIRIHYALEKEHLPECCGQVEYDRAAGALLTPLGDPILCRQLETYVESYLRRKGAEQR